jgi:formamidopyrimidine-DNA glycosylase
MRLHWIRCPRCKKKLGKLSAGARYSLWCRHCKVEILGECQ